MWTPPINESVELTRGALYTVQTVAADLRQGEHIPKMQNNIGRKSMLCVLRIRQRQRQKHRVGSNHLPLEL